MNKKDIEFVNRILSIGLVLIFIGFLLIVAFSQYVGIFLNNVFPIAMCGIGLIFLYYYIAFSRNSLKLFFALAFILNGIFWVILTRKCFSLDAAELWPCFVLITALCIFIVAITKKKNRFANIFTSILIFGLGIIFLLFSLKIIKIPYSQFAIVCMPFILIISGIFLIILFFRRKYILERLPQEFAAEFTKEELNSEDSNF